MAILHNFADRTPREFFQDLSKENGWIYNAYNKKFDVEIDDKTKQIRVVEWDKFSKLNPIRFFPLAWLAGLGPEGPRQKFGLANRLASMVYAYAKDIPSFGDIDIQIINKNLNRIGNHLARNTDASHASAIRDAFARAIDTLKKVDRSTDSLYKKLAKRGFLGFGGFNEKIFISKTPNGGFDVVTEAKPWFFQKIKWIGKYSSAETPLEKIETAENLAEMISAQQGLIRSKRYNVGEMIANLRSIKGRITRNTSPAEKQRIEEAFNSAIATLRKLSPKINADQANDWFPNKALSILVGASLVALSLRVAGPEISFVNQAVATAAVAFGGAVLATPAYNHIAQPLATKALALGATGISAATHQVAAGAKAVVVSAPPALYKGMLTTYRFGYQLSNYLRDKTGR